MATDVVSMGEYEFRHGFGGETRKKETIWKSYTLDWRMILKGI